MTEDGGYPLDNRQAEAIDEQPAKVRPGRLDLANSPLVFARGRRPA